ncbi:hypothetical protein KI387_017652 [Taxus chinensis]|uniref:NB-ARC domain-containing protein n=1 Tax=Taxus chinensis TaxID=29808 RepID=A0AA38LFM1_TAXCH|nr:hypothetical protein KI387_017652 [Taxus chinensis]
MANLVSLHLWGNNRCTDLPKPFGKPSGFPNLRYLRIEYFTVLEEFPELEDGAMPCLEEFELADCWWVKKVGEGLEMLKSLKELRFRGWKNLYIEDANRLKIVRDVLPQVASSSASQGGAERRRSSLLPIDSRPVGIDSKVDYLSSLLDNSAHPLVAVVGMGGMGKTYLLQHVYNKTKQRFEISIWLSISQSYSICNLQYDIANYIGLRMEIVEGKVSEQVAAQLINEKLQGKKCVIVLDDVWKPIMEENLIERLGFRVGSNCTIVITARNKNVCRNLDAEIYEMEYLSEEDSWELFCVHGFPHCEANRPGQELEEVARDILQECGRLPLAIKTTAASLSHTTLPREWAFKLRQLKEVSDLNDPMKILKLSYDCLPAHLQACFAYMCFFSDDEEIDVEYLVNLWIGEGFISEGKEQCDIGVEFAWRDVIDEYPRYGLKKYCRVHDLLHDLAIYIRKENKCAFDAQHTLTKRPSSFGERSGGDLYRILLPRKRIDDGVMAHTRTSGSPAVLRTLQLHHNQIQNIPASMFVNMRALRVLDSSGNPITTLPDCVGKMKLLKLLNLSGTRIDIVPRCVRRLRSLRFLEVSCRLPVWIGELKCLEHINTKAWRDVPKGISNLSSLRTLRSLFAVPISFRDDECLSLEDVGNMLELQEINIDFITDSQRRMIERGILGRLVKMRHFDMTNSSGAHEDLMLFPENLKAMADLESLHLTRFEVTSWLCSFAHLRVLTLYNCGWSNFPELENMANLVSLVLGQNNGSIDLPKAFRKPSGFPKLRYLKIENFRVLEEFPELEDGAMP